MHTQTYQQSKQPFLPKRAFTHHPTLDAQAANIIARSPVQAKLKVGAQNDHFEREADRVADRVMRMPDPAAGRSGMDPTPHSAMSIQRKCAGCEDETLQRKPDGSHRDTPSSGLDSVASTLRQSGRPLDAGTRNYFEPRFGADFSNVRIHTDTNAAASARSVNALAYTVGRDVVFNSGQYAPHRDSGKRLLAHELTHVVQQGAGRLDSVVQRGCSDPDFCKPYATKTETDDAEWWIRNTYLRAEGIETFGTEVKELYESYLSRSPGDSLAPVVFDSESSYLVSSFKNSGDTEDDMDSVIDLVGDRLSRAPSGSISSAQATMSLANFLSTSEMDNRPINYSNPFSVAGHIAGGIGSSDAGDDYRKITYANVGLEKTTLIGSTGYVTVELTPHYEVFDAVDFCPGDCGSPVEQWITVPMSRLEASGAAYDVPFKVIFSPETRSKRFWF